MDEFIAIQEIHENDNDNCFLKIGLIFPFTRILYWCQLIKYELIVHEGDGILIGWLMIITSVLW